MQTASQWPAAKNTLHISKCWTVQLLASSLVLNQWSSSRFRPYWASSMWHKVKGQEKGELELWPHWHQVHDHGRCSVVRSKPRVRAMEECSLPLSRMFSPTCLHGQADLVPLFYIADRFKRLFKYEQKYSHNYTYFWKLWSLHYI